MNPEEPPLEVDVLETAGKTGDKKPPVFLTFSEKDFIGNKPFLKTLPFWAWLFLFAVAAIVVIGVTNRYNQVIEKTDSLEPFLKVTNREFSIFLWQFPSYIRSNVPKKTGYIPGFYFDRVNFDPEKEDDYVLAPPDLLFLYHTWKRQLAPYLIQRSIVPEEFDAFLNRLTEWDPKNWKHAPPGYRTLIESKSYEKVPDMRTLPAEELPLMVRQAFQGWKNYFLEGPEINELTATVGEILEFLKRYPTYARPFWRNIDIVADQEVAGLKYLSIVLEHPEDPEIPIPKDQLSSFLKVALFNAQKNE